MFTFAKRRPVCFFSKGFYMMNDLNKALILAVSILACATMLFFFLFTAERARNEDLLARKEAAYVDARKSIRQAESQNELASTAKASAEKAINEASESFTMASLAKAELERLEAASALEQKEAAALSKARLERETAARMQAEKELDRTKIQRDALLSELQFLAEDIENMKADNAARLKAAADAFEKESSALRAKLEERERENASLKAEKRRLEERASQLKSAAPKSPSGAGQMQLSSPAPKAEPIPPAPAK